MNKYERQRRIAESTKKLYQLGTRIELISMKDSYAPVLTGTRGTLFFEIARIASVKKPKYLYLENVPGLLNHDSGKTFETILNTLNTGSPKSIKLFGERRCSIACEFLTACGWKRVSTACTDEVYDVCWQVLNSKNFGVPQSRNRVFIIGYFRGQCAGEVLSFTQTSGKTLIQRKPNAR